MTAEKPNTKNRMSMSFCFRFGCINLHSSLEIFIWLINAITALNLFQFLKNLSFFQYGRNKCHQKNENANGIAQPNVKAMPPHIEKIV